MNNISEWAGRGGAMKSVHPPPRQPSLEAVGLGGGAAVIWMHASRMRPHLSQCCGCWIEAPHISPFQHSTFSMKAPEFASCTATLPASHKHTISPAFATWRIYSGPSNASGVRTPFHIVRRRRNKLAHQVVASERRPWPFVTSLREVRASVCLISGASKR